MKKYIYRRIFFNLIVLSALIQIITIGSVFASVTLPIYKKTDAYSSCNGKQGKDGWYFMYKSNSTGAYIDMTWTDNHFKGLGGGNINEHFISPGYDAPAVIGWEAPYTGTVTLTAQDNTVYRNGPYPTGEDVIATMKLNNEILTDDNGKETRWVFDNTCYNGSGNQSYTVTNLHINKGDMIYHEVDCGKNCTGAAIYWKPIITYTARETIPDKTQTIYKKADAYMDGNGVQGYNGWFYLKRNKESNKYTYLKWDGNQYSLDGAYVNEHFISPGYDTPAVLCWKAPYSGNINLSVQDDVVYRNGPNPNGSDVTATLRLNDEILIGNNGQKMQWVFDNACYNGYGNQTYKVTNLHVNKGDMLYHEVDCGTNMTGAGVYWKPIVEYTEFDSDEAEQNTYFINTITDYKNYADIVNSTNPSACAKLMTDIEFNRNTPQLINFEGIIDGNNHKITLHGNSLIESAKNGVVIKNLTLDGTVRAENNAAAFIGNIDAAEQGVIIKNCANLANIYSSCNSAAGFVGYVGRNSVLKIKSSYNYGLIISMGNTANAFANSDESAFINCENSYYLSDCTKINETTVINTPRGTQASAKRFASGEIAYNLNKSAGDIAFGQDIGNNLYPVGISDAKKVVYKSDNEYKNGEGLFAALGVDSAAFCADQKAFIVIADYDYDNGMLVSVQCAELDANSIYRTNLTEKAENVERKMFVCNNSNEIIPLCESIVYEPFIDAPDSTTIMTVSFDGQKTKCPIMLVDEYPSIAIDDIAKIAGGEARGYRLNIGDIQLEYEADNRLAKYGDGHLMLERTPRLLGGKLYVPISSLMPTTGWTVEYKRFEDLIIIETGTNYPEPQVTVYVKDYSGIGDGSTYDSEYDRDAVLAAFNAAVTLAEQGTPSKLEFEAGKTYKINEKQDSFALFDLDNINNFTIDGHGSTLVFERPTNGLIDIEGCTNIKVKNLTVKYDEEVISWGTIKSKSVNENALYIDIPEEIHLPADDAWAKYYCTNPTEGPWIFGYIMQPENVSPRFMPFDALWINSIEHVQGREYKITFKHSLEQYIPIINIGDRFVFKSRWNSYDFGEYNKDGRPDFLAVSYSKDVTFDGIKTNGALLMFAPVAYCDGRIVFQNCEMSVTPNSLITSAADGIHLSTNRFGVIIENCNLNNSLDDLINTEAYCGEIVKIIDNYTYETSRDMFCKIGDEIKFFDVSNHAVVGKAFLTKVEQTENGMYRLTLDRTVEGVVSTEDASNPTVIYNMNAANNGNIVRNNRLTNSRRHAYIIRSENSIIEGNYMENNVGAATEAANEIHGGVNEGLFPSSLTFRNNTVKSDGISSKYSPLNIYSWYARQGDQKAIDGVLIENNTIDVPSVNGSIKINSVNDLYMLNNTIKSNAEFDREVSPITILNSNIAQIDGVDFSYKQNVSAVINITGCEVNENDITNIKLIGENTAMPYSIK